MGCLEIFTTYDLVSHGPYTTGTGDGDECWGTYNSSTAKGWGPGYVYSCIHSGLVVSSGDIATVWYNYTLASAGTIFDENIPTQSQPATNIDIATESVCPKGWTLPNSTQINSNREVANFSPVLGGYYYNGALHVESTRGYWWGSNTSRGATRYFLYYTGSGLYTDGGTRYDGVYIRCVQKS